MQRLRLATVGALAGLLLWAPSADALQVLQERIDLDVIEQIREEGFERSRIADLAGYLTDVIGPRLTGSTGMRRANEWTAERLREWGVRNVRVEPWGEFGRGWERVSFAGGILEPFYQPLHAQPLAWSGSTAGPVRGPVVAVDVDDVEDLERYRGRLRGAIVLAGPPAEIEPEFEPRPLRHSLEDLLARGAVPGAAEQMRDERRWEEYVALRRRQMEVQAAARELIREEGAAVVLRPSPWTYGLLRGGGNRAAADPGGPEPLPELLVGHEQYGQMWRNAQRGVPVHVEVDVRNRFLDEDLNAYNTLGDIPGTDLADEYVMIGAHLDSWHMGTGATDNAAGSVVMLEAMRILRALELEPRRTIRIALWSGEEQGLLGSRAWVRNNESIWPRISAYLNVDNGSGRLRGIYAQSNPYVVPIFEQLLAPFRDLGVVTVDPGNTGGTDHLAFDAAGIPGFQFVQDPLEYSTRSHHSYVDTFERLVIDDLQQAAVVVAALAYHLAMRDDPLPRKPPEPATADQP